MASYYVSGYTPPADVKTSADVKAYQKRLGVTADGVWGPKTQAAYDKNGSISTPQSFADYYAMAMSYTAPQTLSVAAFDAEALQKELKGYLRPTVDLSISRRKEAVKTANAELDADAVSRGMGQSTYVLSMKEREQDDAERDVTTIEAQYNAALSEKLYEAMQSYQNRLFEAQAYNAQAAASAQAAALNLASNWYASAQQSVSPVSKGPGTSGKNNVPTLSMEEIYELMGYLDDAERKNLFTGQTAYWVTMREELQNSVSPRIYLLLEAEFMPKAPAAPAGGARTRANYTR